MYVLVSAAPHSTVKPVPLVTPFIAGFVEIVPPTVFKLIVTSDVASSFVLLIVIVPAAVQMNVPFLADAGDSFENVALPVVFAVGKAPDGVTDPVSIHVKAATVAINCSAPVVRPYTL